MTNVFYEYGEDKRLAIRVDGHAKDSYYLLLPQNKFVSDILYCMTYEDWVSIATDYGLTLINLPSSEHHHVLWNIVALTSPELELHNVDRLIKRVFEHPNIYINTDADKAALKDLVNLWLEEMFE